MTHSASENSRASRSPFSIHKAGNDPRAAALVAVAKVLAGEEGSQTALDKALGSPHLVPSDKSLCTELVYGHLRWHIRLEFFSGRFLRRPDKLPWEMVLTLEQALYSMACLRIPHRAAVHWAVEHVRNRFGQAMAKVANGALRSMQRSLGEFSDMDVYLKSAGEESGSAAFHSVPVWLWRQTTAGYGRDEAALFLEASLHTSPQGIRLNMARPGWEASRAELLRDAGERAVPSGACAIAFEGSLPFEAKTLVREGRASRQSAASYSILSASEPLSWPQPLWDCCSGRGGKTMALLEANIDVALASDPSTTRMEALSEEYTRLGLPTERRPRLAVGTAQDLAAAMEAGESFGTVLVDAPCSGLGTLSRHPEIRFRRSEEDCATLALLQAEILDAVWPKLLPEGRLVYITCTINPAENQDQICAFREKHPDAVLACEILPDARSPLREFFYAAVLSKQAEM